MAFQPPFRRSNAASLPDDAVVVPVENGAGGEDIAVGGDLASQLVRLMPRLRRFAYRLAGTGHEAEDLVQSACERALGNVHKFDPGVPIDSWMYRTIQNLFVDGRRAAVVRGNNADPVDPDLLSGGDADREAEASLMLGSVRKAVDALPNDQRQVLILVCVEGLSYREAADELDVPIGTVMSRLCRARTAVQAKLEPRRRPPAGTKRP
jgi:RNA polymerase sigma-70 factor (ECF subfamily)